MIKRILKIQEEILPGIFFIALFVSTISCSNPDSTGTESKSSTAFKAQLEQLFEYCINNSQFSGSVLIARHGNIIYNKSFGLANRGNKTPNTSKTNFNIASTTKPFTAMAVAVLVDQKKLNFDEPVCNYLPEFPYPSVSIRHLLTHTSGTPDYLHRPPFIKYHGAANPDSLNLPPFTNQDILDWLVNSGQDLDFEPGDRLRYCNTGYVMLALIVERVSGQKFTDFLKDHVLIPCGMTNSVMYNLLMNPSITNRAIGYTPSLDRTSFVSTKTNRMDGIIGDSGLYSSAEDLFKFDQVLRTNRLISKKILDEIFTPCLLNNGQKKGYGFGWILEG
jgi:CubicO group peptidase (beta-lactamase class C family)